MPDIQFPQLNTTHDWAHLRNDAEALRLLETAILPPYVNTCRWFAGKARPQGGFSVKTIHEVPMDNSLAYLLLVEARYSDGGESEIYQLPISFVGTEGNSPVINPKGILTIAYFNQTRGLLVDALYDERFQQALFRSVATTAQLPQEVGKLSFHRGKGLDPEDIRGAISSRVLGVDSSNSALIFGSPSPGGVAHGEKYFLKLYRKLFRQTNPEVELVEFLTEHSNFAYIPAFAGSLTWQRDGIPDVTLGMMQRMVENQQDTWGVTGGYVGDFLQGFLGRQFCVNELVFEEVELLARRTAEMHLGLFAPEVSDPMFRTEGFSDDYRAFLIGRITRLLDTRYALLIDKYLDLDPQAQRLAWVFMEAKELLDEFLSDFRQRPFHSLRTRVHGDYHLGQVLHTGRDYVIIDFEGEPESSIADRKIKHSPLKDVAGMIRSYHYAVSAGLFNAPEGQQADPTRITVAADRWYRLMRDTYLDTYLATFGPEHPLFKNNTEINFLLLVYLLEKAVYELGYELSYRPTWVKIPLKGIVDVVREVEKLREA